VQTITILTGLTTQDGQPAQAQLLYSDGLQPEDVLLALRQVEGQAIVLVVEAAERRGREMGPLEPENEAENDE
jgi:hypothetical protein